MKKENWACTIHQGKGTTSDTTFKNECENCLAKKEKTFDNKEKHKCCLLFGRIGVHSFSCPIRQEKIFIKL